MARKISALCLFAALLALPAAAAQRWLGSVEEALALAAKEDRLILVDLYAEWCGWCKVLEKDVFSSPEFQAWAEDFVLLRVDVEDGADGTALQARFGAYGLPTTVVMDRHRVQVGTVAGYAPTEEFLRKVESEMASHRALLAYYDTMLQRSDAEAPALERLAEELHTRGDGRRAVAVYERLRRQADPGTPRAAWLEYRAADAYRIAGLFDEASRTAAEARRLAAAAKAESLGEQIDLLSYQIADDSGDCKGAVSSLEHFLKAHPKSTHRSQARQTLNALRHDDLCV